MVRVFVSEMFRWIVRKAAERGIPRGRPGAVTFIQRFSSSLLLYPHLHVLALDGVYAPGANDQRARFHATASPGPDDIRELCGRVTRVLSRWLDRNGFLSCAGDNDAAPPTALDAWYAAVLSDRAAWGVVDERGEVRVGGGGRAFAPAPALATGGFSLHASVRIDAGDPEGRRRLACYAARPPLADAQLTETPDGRIAVELRRPRQSGHTHLLLEPVRLLRRLAWIIPPPRRHQIRFSGVLAPHARLRPDIVPASLRNDGAADLACRGKGAQAIPWSVLLAKVYDTDALACERCGGRLRPIAVISQPAVAQKILRHLGLPADLPRFAPARAPP
jgi:hypothetical protein